MIGRVLLAAILAGLAAGLVMSVIQHVRLTPLILHAEVFEEKSAEGGHDHATPPAQPEAAVPAEGTATAETHEHDEDAWAPADGLERTFYTTMFSMLAGAGYALALAGVALLAGLNITRQNAVLWGLSGFLAVSLAPAVGLPPELPGMPAADVTMRQIWWAATVLFTGAGLYLLATRQNAVGIAIAIVLFIAPHLYGAPEAPTSDSHVPAGLAAEFAANSLAANLVMWVLIGVFLSITLAKVEGEAKA
ncbi:MAG: CbtA family protein [Proteobacteria bacterium]|nr:CbtA family protein [Pseudomonadota bacterium]